MTGARMSRLASLREAVGRIESRIDDDSVVHAAPRDRRRQP